MIAVAKVLLRNLQFGHLTRLWHSTEEGTHRFTWLEVDRAILDLDNDIIEELTIERLELQISLLSAVRIGRTIDESTPHDNTLIRLERLGQHIGTLSVCTAEVIRSRLAL